MEEKEFKNLNKFRSWSLAMAEQFDAWRIVPRAIVVGYAWLIGYMVLYFLSHDNIQKVDCNAAVMTSLLDKKYTLDQATQIACRVVEVIGPPTSLTTIVGSLIGAGAVVFGLYANTGRKWNGFTAWGKKKEAPKQTLLSEHDEGEHF